MLEDSFYKEHFPFRAMRFSHREIKDLLKAWIAISLAFALLYSFQGTRFSIFAPSSVFSLSQFSLFFAISLFTAGIGFLLHELAHKIVAQKYGAKAEFHSFDGMLLLALFMSFFGFLFAAPGAVFIHKRLSRGQNGKVSAAGPLTNIALAVFFLLFSLVFGNSLFLRFGLSINAWLALFNMLPFLPFDGGKVWQWSRGIWLGVVVVALALVIFG